MNKLFGYIKSNLVIDNQNTQWYHDTVKFDYK